MAKGLKASAKKLEKQLKNPEKTILSIIKKHEETIKDMIRGQMMRGIKGDGTIIGRYKPGKYADMKRTMNPHGLVDLYLDGTFQKEIFVDADDFPVVASSFDWKTSFLVDNYGEDIFQLTKENKEALFNLLNKEFIAHFKF